MSLEQEPPSWAKALMESVQCGIRQIAEMNAKADRIEHNVELLQHDAKDTRLRVGRIERELDDVREQQRSAAVRPSEHDLETQAALACEVEHRKALDAKVDALNDKLDQLVDISTKAEKGLARMMGNPTFRTLLILAATAASAWLSTHGGHVK